MRENQSADGSKPHGEQQRAEDRSGDFVEFETIQWRSPPSLPVPAEALPVPAKALEPPQNPRKPARASASRLRLDGCIAYP